MIFLSLGLGQLLMMGSDLSDMSQVMAVMILIIILGFMVDGLIFRTMERRLHEKYGLTLNDRQSKCRAKIPDLTVRIKGEVRMSKDTSTTTHSSNGTSLSLDTWAVIVAFLLALAVRFDIFENVRW